MRRSDPVVSDAKRKGVKIVGNLVCWAAWIHLCLSADIKLHETVTHGLIVNLTLTHSHLVFRWPFDRSDGLTDTVTGRSSVGSREGDRITPRRTQFRDEWNASDLATLAPAL